MNESLLRKVLQAFAAARHLLFGEDLSRPLLHTFAPIGTTSCDRWQRRLPHLTLAYRREQHEQRGAEHPKTIAILRSNAKAYEMVLLSSNVNVAFFMGRAIVGVLWAVRGDVMSEVLEDFFASRPMLFLSGLLALAIGIAMAISHSIWELNWRGLITLIGYLSIAKGIARVGFPEVTQRAAGFLLKGTRNWIWISIVLVLGGYLTWVGFTRG